MFNKTGLLVRSTRQSHDAVLGVHVSSSEEQKKGGVREAGELRSLEQELIMNLPGNYALIMQQCPEISLRAGTKV